jgi:hypothetical protein
VCGGAARGSYVSRGASTDGSSFAAIIVVGIFLFIIITAVRQKGSANLDQLFSRGDIEKKSVKTVKLLEFISQQDSSVAPDDLKKTSRRPSGSFSSAGRPGSTSP